MNKERRLAAEKGEKQYSTNRKCSKGHDSKRYVVSGACVKCVRNYRNHYSEIRKRSERLAVYGMRTYEVQIDVRDEQVFLDFVDALKQARVLTEMVAVHY